MVKNNSVCIFLTHQNINMVKHFNLKSVNNNLGLIFVISWLIIFVRKTTLKI